MPPRQQRKLQQPTDKTSSQLETAKNVTKAKSAISLILLILQSSGLILYLKPLMSNQAYSPTNMVAQTELCKIFLSYSLEVTTRILYNRQQSIIHHLISPWIDFWEGCDGEMLWSLAIPAALYTFQNNLNYFALSRLDAVSFQVLQQLKIPVTALFSISLLGRRIGRLQWIALFLLCIGVVFVQLSPEAYGTKPNNNNVIGLLDRMLGSSAVILICTLSAYAGIHFEKILKQGHTSPHNSLWLRSMQFSTIGFIFALIPCAFSSQAFTLIPTDGGILLAVVLFALGGLLVAATVKYADSIIKAFATSASIVLSSMVTHAWEKPSSQMTFGIIIVVCSVFLYATPPKYNQR